MMEKEYIQVSFENGNIERKSYPAGIRLLDLAKEYQKEDDIVLAKVNGRLRELYLQLTEDCRISFITTRQQEGMAAYRRSMTLLLLKALYHQAGHEHIRRVGIHFSVSSGYYCTVDGDVTLDQDFLGKVEARMRELVAQKVPIDKKNDRYGRCDRIVLAVRDERQRKIVSYRRASKVNIYDMGGFEDYYYGYMIPDTSYLGAFSLHLYEDGFVLQMPQRKDPKTVPAFEPENKMFRVRKNRSNGERCSKFLP